MPWDSVRDAKCRWAVWFLAFKFQISSSTNHRFERNLADLLSAAEHTVSAALQLIALDMLDFLPDSNAFQFLFLGERLSMASAFLIEVGLELIIIE